MAIGGTSLAGLGTDCHVSITIQPFLPGLVWCSLLFSSAHSQPRSPLMHSSLPSSIDAQCTTEYKSELSCYVLAPDERYQYEIELRKCNNALGGNCTPGSRIATGCNSLVAQARRCSSFKLTHMSCEDHAQLIKSTMASKGKTRTYHSTHNFPSTVTFGM